MAHKPAGSINMLVGVHSSRWCCSTIDMSRHEDVHKASPSCDKNILCIMQRLESRATYEDRRLLPQLICKIRSRIQYSRVPAVYVGRTISGGVGR
jgi:hypothetical protein